MNMQISNLVLSLAQNKVAATEMDQLNEKEERLAEIQRRLDAYTRSQPVPRQVSRLIVGKEYAAVA